MALNKRSLGALVLLLGFGAVLAVVGHRLLFTTFMVYDDEGYVLYSLRNYIAHGGLYADVYSQYGPFFYNFYDTLQRVLPLEYDNDSGRWITLVNWLTAAGAASVLVWRYSRSIVHALFALGMTFLCLWVMKSEPMHPGGLLTALVTLGTIAGAIMIERERPVAFAIGGALFGVALLLTKINVGVFFLTAVGGWMLVNTRRSAVSRFSFTGLVALGCAALPFLLMHSLWDERWVRTFALMVSTSSLGLILALHRSRRPEHTPRTWIWLAGVGFAWAFLVVLLSWMRGTSWMDLVHGVLLEPLKHPGVYSLPIRWTNTSILLALGSLFFAAWLYSRKDRPAWVSPMIAGLRFVVLGWFLLSDEVSMGKFGLLHGLPLIWLLVTPLHAGAITARDRARLWVGWVLVFQSLHAYPVAGSQINWGACLFPAVLAMGIYEALAYVKERRPTFARGLTALGAAVLLLPLASLITSIGKTCATYYAEGVSLGLHGAEQVRMPEDFTDTLRIVAANLDVYAVTLFSYPGLYSMNIWTGKPTPTLANATHWFTLLATRQQQAIIDQIKADPKACVVVQRDVIDFLGRTGFSTKSPLRDYLVNEFSPALNLSGYSIWIHKARVIEPVDIASLEQIGPGPRLRLSGVIRLGEESIACVELRAYKTPPLLVQTIHLSATTPIATTLISPDVASLASAPPARLLRFTVEFTAAFPPLDPVENYVVLKASDGRILARLRFAH